MTQVPPRPETWLWLASPVWLGAVPLLAWSWLVAGYGGQPVPELGWFRIGCGMLSPWLPDVGLRWMLAPWTVLTLVPILTAAALARHPTLASHARAALRDGLLLLPMLALTPWVTGLVATLPHQALAWPLDGTPPAPEAQLGQRCAGVLLAAMLLALPAVGRWPAQVRAAANGEAPLPRARYEHVWVPAVVALGALMTLGRA